MRSTKYLNVLGPLLNILIAVVIENKTSYGEWANFFSRIIMTTNMIIVLCLCLVIYVHVPMKFYVFFPLEGRLNSNIVPKNIYLNFPNFPGN